MFLPNTRSEPNLLRFDVKSCVRLLAMYSFDGVARHVFDWEHGNAWALRHHHRRIRRIIALPRNRLGRSCESSVLTVFHAFQ